MGELLLEKTVKSALLVADEVLIVGKGAKPKEFKGAKWIVEPFTGYSPLYGILTALKEARGERVLILPGDCPLVRAEVLRLLTEKEPPAFIERNYLFAVLKKENFLLVEEMVRKGVHKVRELHRRLKSREIKVKEVKPFDFKGVSFTNLNYFDEYRNLFLGRENEKADGRGAD